MEKLNLDEASKPEITISTPTVEEETQRVKDYVGPQRSGNAKNIALPQGIDPIENDQQTIEMSVSQEYDPAFYKVGLEQIQEVIPTIQSAVETLRQFEDAWGFKISDSYKILLTRYGSLGSYNVENKTIRVRVNSSGVVRKNPAQTPIHELTHLCLEHLVERYKLSHEEKERLVSGVYTTLFPEIFDPQSKVSYEDRLAHVSMLYDLPQVIEKVIAERQN